MGVTHAVDKFPTNNEQRAGDLNLAAGVEFREGDLEAIPFGPYEANEPGTVNQSNSKFDYLYVSHVLEHVKHPEKAISEVNRVTERGYIATPSPLREQLSCPYPFVGEADFHRFFCWRSRDSKVIHVLEKSADRLGEFCGCRYGLMAERLFKFQRIDGLELESLMPTLSKETRVYFATPLNVVIHSSFVDACADGACAYRSVKYVTFWTSPFTYWVSSRLGRLRAILKKPI